MFTSNSIKKLLLISVVVLLATTSDALAWNQGGCTGDVFDVVRCKIWQTFIEVRGTVFIIGGFGLVGLALGAIFGRLNWKWFGALAFGLVLLAVAGKTITYTTGSSYTDTVFSDPLT